jgi:hypothetical protein
MTDYLLVTEELSCYLKIFSSCFSEIDHFSKNEKNSQIQLVSEIKLFYERDESPCDAIL